jgi:glycosyltransferase involved in cell wall biosynthesis
MKKFYDCSNSTESPPHHIENNGPKQNDIARGLDEYADVFGWQRTYSPVTADLFFTNDVYPKWVYELDKPRVKRMDGVYWDESLVERNIPLNEAAMKSNRVIFISQYSQDSYYNLYGSPLKNDKVILNCVDDTVYFPMAVEKPRDLKVLVASASNWSRLEKRFDDLMFFMSTVATEYQLHLIGECNHETPSNVICHGYINDEREVNRIMNMAKYMVNFSYRDPAPKVVCQAVNCRLPVFFANSGGTAELVDSGVGVKDEAEFILEDTTPVLHAPDIETAWAKFAGSKNMLTEDSKYTRFNYMNMLSDYFHTFGNALNHHRLFKSISKMRM